MLYLSGDKLQVRTKAHILPLRQCSEKLVFAQGRDHFGAVHHGHPLLVTLYLLNRRHIALPGPRRAPIE